MINQMITFRDKDGDWNAARYMGRIIGYANDEQTQFWVKVNERQYFVYRNKQGQLVGHKFPAR